MVLMHMNLKRKSTSYFSFVSFNLHLWTTILIGLISVHSTTTQLLITSTKLDKWDTSKCILHWPSGAYLFPLSAIWENLSIVNPWNYLCFYNILSTTCVERVISVMFLHVSFYMASIVFSFGKSCSFGYFYLAMIELPKLECCFFFFLLESAIQVFFYDLFEKELIWVVLCVMNSLGALHILDLLKMSSSKPSNELWTCKCLLNTF